jgi:HK97 family phage portal protein
MIRTLLERKATPSTYRFNWTPFRRSYEPNQPQVTDSTVLGIPAAWRAVDLLQTVIATMPLHAYRGDQRLERDPKILEQPNSLETRFETVGSIVYSLAMRGNAYLLLGGYDSLERPTELEVVHPDLVSIDTSSGELLYRVGDSEPLTRSELLHLRYLKIPGSPYGVGPVEACRLGLSNVIALETYGRQSFTDNGVPSAVINVEGDLSPEEATEMKGRWMASASTREPRILPSDMKVTPLAFTPQDSQFLESKKLGITEIANIFGVPATRLGGDGSSMTYRNAEQDDFQFLKYTIQPWLIRIEQPLSTLLPHGQRAKFNPDTLLRASTQVRYKTHQTALDAGFMTPNEVRSLEQLPPIAGGDQLGQQPTNPARINEALDKNEEEEDDTDAA